MQAKLSARFLRKFRLDGIAETVRRRNVFHDEMVFFAENRTDNNVLHYYGTLGYACNEDLYLRARVCATCLIILVHTTT